MGGGGPKRIGTIPGGGGDSDQASPVKLFRFFDFTVQPGKQYRYRVQLWWTNPNCTIPRQYLVNPDDAKESYVKTEWSAPSESVGVPLDARILAGEVIKQHPERCKVGIAYFDIASGSEAFETLEVERGQWLNFSGKTLHTRGSGQDIAVPWAVWDRPQLVRSPVTRPAPNPARHPARSTSTRLRPPTLRRPPPHPPTVFTPNWVPRRARSRRNVKVDYVTETLLLDVAGGAQIHGHDTSLKEPGHLLLLDSQGNLVVLHELTDEDEIESVTDPSRQDRETSKGPPQKDTGNGLSDLMGPPTPP